MKDVFKPNGFWAALGLLLLVIVIFDFLQAPNGGLGLFQIFTNFISGITKTLTAIKPQSVAIVNPAG